ncbi:universal stress protein [Aureisphaera galaxeae]|uniref:universal stress protein n=1 Tax=Aureisphaera galaxeae TaxID=1538023 RepID=UPI00234FFF0F|nr:universal stress protein [Aureisphaera galaxeae]MDC8003765.1 universal stress protein [Aureisphaera galaxeae]
MKKIIVPVDFSEHSEYALEVAAQLAKKYDSQLIMVHMMGLEPSFLTKDESQEVFEAMYYMKLTERRFEDFLEKDYLQDVNVQTIVQNYKEFKELDSVAKEQNADLIVMGSHGSSGMREIFVGSNTEKVVRTSSVPVLVIKNRIMNFNLDSMVFVCDFSKDYVPAFQKARDFAKTFGAKFQMLYVNTPERFHRTSVLEEKAYDFLLAANDEDKELYNGISYYCDNTIEDGIFTYSNAYGADVIAVPTHGRKGLMHFFAGSLGEELVNHAKTPVVTFKI